MANMTQNYYIKLLECNQAMKELTINHGFHRLDWLINRGVLSLIEDLPSRAEPGDMYIITDGTETLKEHKGKVALFIDGKWEFLTLSKASVFFVLELRAFFCFDGQSWQQV